MNTKLQALVDAAQELSASEQLELISHIAQSLGQRYEHTHPADFWQPKTLAQLIEDQGVQPVGDIKELTADCWPEEESIDDFLEFIQRQRHEDILLES